MSLIASRIDETPYGGGSGEKVDGVRGNITMNFLKSASREGAEEKTIRRAATFIIGLSTIALAGLSIVRWFRMDPTFTLPEPTFIENVAPFAYILLLSIALVLRRSKSPVAAGALVFLSAGNLVWFYWTTKHSGNDSDIAYMAGAHFASIIWAISLLITVRALQATMTLKKAFKNEPPPLPVIPNPRVMEPHATKTCSMASGGTAFEPSDHFPHDKEFFYSPAAPIGRLRQWKIALSLAVVGALAAPFAFRTYKARPWYSVSVPLTAQEKEKLADQFLNSGKHCEDIAVFPDQPPEGAFFVPVGEDDFCYEIRVKLDRGATEEVRPDRSKYWMMNVGTAAATAVSLFGLTFLVPMLIRGVAFLARRYWRWLNA